MRRPCSLQPLLLMVTVTIGIAIRAVTSWTTPPKLSSAHTRPAPTRPFPPVGGPHLCWMNLDDDDCEAKDSSSFLVSRPRRAFLTTTISAWCGVLMVGSSPAEADTTSAQQPSVSRAVGSGERACREQNNCWEVGELDGALGWNWGGRDRCDPADPLCGADGQRRDAAALVGQPVPAMPLHVPQFPLHHPHSGCKARPQPLVPCPSAAHPFLSNSPSQLSSCALRPCLDGGDHHCWGVRSAPPRFRLKCGVRLADKHLLLVG